MRLQNKFYGATDVREMGLNFTFFGLALGWVKWRVAVKFDL